MDYKYCLTKYKEGKLPSSVNVFEGAFHHAKDPGNFGRKSNGKVRLGFFRQEYMRDHLWRWSRDSSSNITTELPSFLFPVPLFCHLLDSSWPILGAYNLLLVTNVPFVAILKQTYPMQLLMHSASAMTGMCV